MSLPRRALPLALVALVLATVSAGCGKREKSEIVVAEVGPRKIMLDYFERKMNTMDPQFVPSDIDTQEGREKLLEVMINKEIMALKAEELGLAADGVADQQAEQVALFAAVGRMRDDVTAPAQNPTEEDLLDYYEKLPRRITVSYMLFDHQEQAIAARKLVEGGELWRNVAERLQAGDPGPSKDYTLFMRYGTVADDLEQVVFDLPIGAISQPLDTVYGWFLIRVDDVTMEKVEPMEALRERIRESVIKQNSTLLVARFVAEILEEYDFEVDEDVLQLVFDALPEDVPLSPPPNQADLEPLRVEPIDLDRVLMRYHDQVWTVRRFSDFYDQSSAFGRPRRQQRLGNLRRLLKEQAVRDLMPVAARARGYMQNPEVQDELKMRREQAMVTRLHAELISGEVKVEPADVERFWAEHAQEYFRPETRDVMAVIAPSENDALSAVVDSRAGVEWKEIVEKYCIPSDVKSQGGAVLGLTADAGSPLAEHAFRLESEGELCMPVEIGPDQWLVMQLVRINPEQEPRLEEMRVPVGRRVQAIKEEELFQRKVAEWRAGYPVTIYGNRLMKAEYAPVPPVQSIPIRVGGGL
jgi:peptidyl-prolyl cis-trans isomerase C